LPCRQVVPAAAPVAWWSAASRRDRDDLARWCETVGPVLFEPARGSDDAPPSDRLVVVSWNVHVGSGDVDGLVRSLRAGELTGGTPVNNFVLLLQEAYRRDDVIPVRLQSEYAVPSRIAARRGRGPDVSHLWRDAGLALLYVPSMRNGFTDSDREDRGNAIVSTLSLRQPTVIELPLEHQRRVVAAAVVEGRTTHGEPWMVRLADVHLDTALALMRGGPSAARRRQAEALVTALAATAPKADHLTTIVAGDFNTIFGSREPAIAYLRRAFPDGPAPPDVTTFSGPLGFHATLDHVFVGGRATSVEVRRLPSRFGSDHYPLLATVSF
jgi:endonuclease/exonuclease/phosphatase family metal-dependent hydrolase